MGIRKEARALAAAAALGGALAGPVDAETWRINAEGTGEAPTLQAAIDEATSGDTIEMAPGIYRDTVVRDLDGSSAVAVAFLKRGVTIVGDEGPLATFIDGEEDHHCLAGEDLDHETKVRGVTLLHGDALDPASANGRAGGGMLLYDSSPELEAIRFVGCNSLDGGGGLRVVGSWDGEQQLAVHDCAFIYCFSGGRGGGAELIDLEAADVKYNTFAGNFSQVRGGGLAVVGHRARVENNVWWLNCAHLEGGPIWCEDASVDAECNLFWQNFPEIDEDPLDCDVDVGGGDEPNTIADPLFCDPDAEDFTVHGQSPAAPKNSGKCGRIGAYLPACGIAPRHLTSATALPAEESERTATGGLEIRVSPNPARAEVHLVVSGEGAAAAAVEIFDVQGRRIRSLRRAGESSATALAWDGRDESGRRVVAGIYFARLTAGARSAIGRVVVRP